MKQTQAELEKKQKLRELFGTYVETFQTETGCSQAHVAKQLGYAPSTLTKWLNGDLKNIPKNAIDRAISLFKLNAKQKTELLDLAGYVILPTLTANSPSFSMRDGSLPYNDISNLAARAKYLAVLCRRYNFVALPIGPVEGFSLQAIFQPLKLRRDPLSAEDLVQENLLSEQVSRRPGYRSQQTISTVIAENANDALKKSPKRSMVILGGPGTGKTTLLKSFVRDHAEKALNDPTAPIPIFISLPDLTRSGKTLKEYLISVVQDMMVDEHYALVLWKSIEQGKALVCLDSLDEVTPKLRPDKIKLINEWAANTSSIYIVGSRFTDYKGGLLRSEKFAEWELQPMTSSLRNELANRLIRELYQSLSPTDVLSNSSVSTFVTTLEKHERAVTWGENPLLFSLAAVVFVRSGLLPSSRTLLYQQVINAVLQTREPDSTQLLSVLACLALELFQEKGRAFTRNDLFHFLRLVRDRQNERWDTEEMAYRIINSGILEVINFDTYGFIHQTFQEYLAAVELGRRLASQVLTIQEETWQLIWSKRTYSRWTEILRLLVGILVQEQKKMGRQQALRWLRKLVTLRASTEGDPGNLGLTLALKSLSEITKSSNWDSIEVVQLEQEIVSVWAEELLDAASRNRQRKEEQLEALASEVGHLHEQAIDVAIGRFVTVLKDVNTKTRTKSAKVLGALGERVPLEPLLAALENEDRWDKGTFVQALKAHRERVPIEPLLNALYLKNRDIVCASISLLGGLGERAPLEPLFTALKNEDIHVRCAAIRALGEQGKRVPLEPLLTALQSENKMIRYAALEALKERKEPALPIEVLLIVLKDALLDDEHDPMFYHLASEVLKEQGERISLDTFLAAMQSEDKRIRYATLKILGIQGERVPLEPLLAALQDEDRGVRYAALEALKIQGERVPLEPLLAALQDKDENVLCAVRDALEIQGERVPLEPLLAALRDKDSLTCSWAARMLVARGKHVSLEPLLAALQDKNGYVRIAASRALGELGEQVPIEPLLTALQDDNKNVYYAATSVLRDLGDRLPLESLVVRFNSGHWIIRETAVEILRVQGNRAPLEPLLMALQDESGSVRRAAIRALGEQGERAPLEPLLFALKDKDVRVRCAAIRALGEQGERAPLEPLLISLQNKDERIRHAAVRALGAQKGRTPIKLLSMAVLDEDVRVRMAAVRVLGTLGEHAPLELLLTALTDEDTGYHFDLDPQDESGNMRSAAVEALKEQGNRVSIDSLLRILKHENPVVRVAVIELLGVQGERLPLEPLLAALEDEDIQVRCAAIRALSEQGERVSLEPLLAALEDEDVEVRATVIEALGKQGERAPLEPVLSALHDKSRLLRQAAVKALGVLGERAPLELLLAALHDSNEYVRVEATRALGMQGERVPHDPLLAALQDKDIQVRASVAEVLGTLGECVPLESMLAMLQHESQYFRQVALNALKAQRKCVPLQLFIDMLNDEDMYVRAKAIRLLKEIDSGDLSAVISEAIAILLKQSPAIWLGSLTKNLIAEAIGGIGYNSPILLKELTRLLDWPHWQVRVMAAQALSKIRRSIPDEAIKELLKMHRYPDPHMPAVQIAADDALAEILSLETGIEDD